MAAATMASPAELELLEADEEALDEAALSSSTVSVSWEPLEMGSPSTKYLGLLSEPVFS